MLCPYFYRHGSWHGFFIEVCVALRIQFDPLPSEDGVRLLIVDDHPVMRRGVAALLSAEPDFEVVGEAEDGQRAIQLAVKLEPDVVLMDVSLPKLGGTEALQRILERVTAARVLMLSAHEEAAFARLALSLGAAGYALKRSACDELVRAVRVVAGGGTYVDPALSDALARAAPAEEDAPGGQAVSLSEREAEVVRLTVRGYTSKEMAESLGISPRTLETYKARAMSKLGLHTRADLIRYALRCGWLSNV